MTFEEWWKKELSELGGGAFAYCDEGNAERFAEAAWNAAIAIEREACAELVDGFHTWITNVGAATAIRARSNVKLRRGREDVSEK